MATAMNANIRFETYTKILNYHMQQIHEQSNMSTQLDILISSYQHILLNAQMPVQPSFSDISLTGITVSCMQSIVVPAGQDSPTPRWFIPIK